MKNTKIGFTLAEILIALSIVGVIAATVIPMFVNDMQKQTSGISLGRAIRQIELGCSNIISLANSESTDGTYVDTLGMITEADIGHSAQTTSILTNLANIVPVYWGLAPESLSATTVKSISIKKYDGKTNDTDTKKVQGSTLYNFAKTHAAIAIHKGKSVISSNRNEDTGYTIYIDTNGWSTRPNMAGKDIFAFKLLNNGKLIPADGLSANGTDAGEYAMKAMENGFKLNY